MAASNSSSATPLGLSQFAALNLKENAPPDSSKMTLVEKSDQDRKNRGKNQSTHGNIGLPTGSVLLAFDEADLLKKSLQSIIASINLHDEALETKIPQSTKYIKAYLYGKEPEFVRLMEHRIRGWFENKEKGDAFFQAQRQVADNAVLNDERYFYNMMKEIAKEMHTKTYALRPGFVGKIKVLDICMAPGGFTDVAMEKNPKGEFYGITLPKQKGGHEVLVSSSQLRGCRSIDVTMLRELAAGKEIPKSHPEYLSFLIEKPYKFHSFHLIFCDGIVLRTHERPIHRHNRETERMRLVTAQLTLAMSRIVHGGTIILLQHKLDSWTPARIVYSLSKFANICVFKPEKKHASRSSFYTIARNINTLSVDFRTFLKRCQDDWYEATFGGENGTGQYVDGEDESEVLDLILNFGKQLSQLGHPIWKVQADALAKTEYAGEFSHK